MKLLIDYKANQKGYALIGQLDCDIEQDAEALGYIAAVLFQSAKTLADLMERANPKYAARLVKGVAVAQKQIEQEKNPYFPFTTIVETDETKGTE